MGNFEETFKDLLLEFIKRRGIEAVEVTNYEEDVREYFGGCETCGDYDREFTVEIYYRTGEETRPAWYGPCYTYDGKFSDLLGELIEIGKELDGQ